MLVEPIHLLGAVAIGIGATLLMELWNLFLKRTFRMALHARAVDPAHAGRHVRAYEHRRQR